jgi:DNA polymerase-4
VEPDGDLDADLDAGAPSTAGAKATTHTWAPGMDVEHAEMGRGWVWGSGRGVVTVRFETAATGPGPVRSLKADDPALQPWRPESPDGSTVPDMHERHR